MFWAENKRKRLFFSKFFPSTTFLIPTLAAEETSAAVTSPSKEETFVDVTIPSRASPSLYEALSRIGFGGPPDHHHRCLTITCA